jgi:hypothetical protein
MLRQPIVFTAMHLPNLILGFALMVLNELVESVISYALGLGENHERMAISLFLILCNLYC